ncbi:DUF4386 domain-containing protein [Amnibacterium sp.]|uniref:DUF4386 domain-containing protein n=1 Tax=Amnibacterium sp. TaxID=1872496 RepID=UPI0026061461|nr:DUF4386 domain-containing protein [Amnibacterium sp.]MCU1472835.1 hypothetical protein [Amnibacterium sp.]
MTQSTLSGSPLSAQQIRAPGGSSANRPSSRMTQSRIIGALFLAGFLVYGTGSSIASSLAAPANFLATIGPVQSLLTLGAFLILLNTAVDVAKAVLFFPILERHSTRTALTYLAAIIVEVLFLSIGALALLMIVPLAQHAGEPGASTLASLLVQLNGMSYQIGEMALGVGATFLCLLLFKTGLVPRWLALSGLIGYPCLVAGTIAELFGVHIGLYLMMPGFFFELVLPAWLLIKGFQKAAYSGRVEAISVR